MRTLIQLDLKIDKDECLALLDDYADFIKEHTGIECEFYVERKDFSVVPTVVDSDGDLKPTDKYHRALEKDVHKRYGDYGVDNLVMWVHEDNFLYKGIWGVNRSYFYYKYSFQLCRWDKDNDANTFGTLNHEIGHSFDTLIKKELGTDINKLFGFDWDSVAIHGQGQWEYVGRKTGKENKESLKMVAPYIKEAYAKRKAQHLKKLDLMKQIISLLSTVVSLLSKKK